MEAKDESQAQDGGIRANEALLCTVQGLLVLGTQLFRCCLVPSTPQGGQWSIGFDSLLVGVCVGDRVSFGRLAFLF